MIRLKCKTWGCTTPRRKHKDSFFLFFWKRCSANVIFFCELISSEMNSFSIKYCAWGRPGTAPVSPYEFEVVADEFQFFPGGSSQHPHWLACFPMAPWVLEGSEMWKKISNQTVGEQQVGKKRLKDTVLFQLKKVFQEGMLIRKTWTNN